MSHDIEIIRKNQNKTSTWTGGTTTELYIYPKDSTYVNHNFKWRLSSAKVELEESKFTLLPGINRLIMVIEGELLLFHEGHPNATLKAFEKHSFSGEWNTTSFGKVTDFNLMMSHGYNGNLEVITFLKDEFKDILLYDGVKNVEKLTEITEVFYIVEGVVEILTQTKEKIYLSEGDLALITRTEKEFNSEFKIQSICHEDAKIIKTSIFYRG
jgi:environmental stress-induced protein Ves